MGPTRRPGGRCLGAQRWTKSMAVSVHSDSWHVHMRVTGRPGGSSRDRRTVNRSQIPDIWRPIADMMESEGTRLKFLPCADAGLGNERHK